MHAHKIDPEGFLDIRSLGKLNYDPLPDWGLNGYKTDKILAVCSIETPNEFELILREKKQSYQKDWKQQYDIEMLNAIISEGHSFGAFYQSELIGWVICRFRADNRSLVIENMLVSEPFRGQNIGRMLIKAANREARSLGCRMVELETQNTNYPAVEFYRKCGFSITGWNSKRYEDATETAVFMSYDLID
ncbi:MULTISPECIES: GNAT family N-acetyltransferase [Chryseobacterium]|uniref:Ribosomal protein S18 acetylase RimI-like enzyme n=1 Tax=Chryseobacterium camelliae TaxID=1265445 RepID=A0ABU0TDX3_9FLAO|nr:MULTISPECIES: GNAT family N-acetyltransferase [Chryseobacterium]MDT3406934.1 ribosomal protein S18 acetylase RimI-like enzyme [Pseudacidovorax intermedius]MDQ1095273.1 ribosomal protein S18 acetylase RimI-like enzyme [Chryseobacterium camelliae]MDQ1099211.1 ribosomal protein S18 acetylase RimI-like enzyme [Chryseobacterium sp. SORGH_AS_1048]MDR6086561.1 ribosomal protein S18 acetylase RimI-like enzyme [Chryseobacterium sp. SORGH_AS_0909]MDR6130931.1 ribosomal protein S18 acetylase RimI-like